MILCNDFGQNNGHKNWPSWYMRSQRGWWCWKVEVTREPQHWSIGAPGRRQVVKDQHWTNIDPALLLPPHNPALESTLVFLILLLNHLLHFWSCSTLAFLILLWYPLLPYCYLVRILTPGVRISSTNYVLWACFKYSDVISAGAQKQFWLYVSFKYLQLLTAALWRISY